MSDSDAPSFRTRWQRRLPDLKGVQTRLLALLPQIRSQARALHQRFRASDGGSLADRLSALDTEYVERGAENISESDLETVVERADAIEERFRNKGPLRELLEDGRLLLEFVRDVRRGRYKRVPVWTLSAAGFALLYVLNPFDVIPDALPLVGLLDDAAVVSACLALLKQDLYDYRAWRQALPDDQDKSERSGEISATDEESNST